MKEEVKFLLDIQSFYLPQCCKHQDLPSHSALLFQRF